MTTKKKTTSAAEPEVAAVEDEAATVADESEADVAHATQDEAEEASYDLSEQEDDELAEEDYASEDSLTFSNGVIEKIVARLKSLYAPVKISDALAELPLTRIAVGRSTS